MNIVVPSPQLVCCWLGPFVNQLIVTVFEIDLRGMVDKLRENVDFVITTGQQSLPDGEATTIDNNIGQF